MQALGVFSRFEQCVLNMALINMCDGEGYIAQEMKQRYHAWQELTQDNRNHLWQNVHQFTIYLPHPEQKYEDLTLEMGLTNGYNIDVELVEDTSTLFYRIPEGGHFVVVFRQRRVNGNFEIAATGIFVRALSILKLDAIIDLDQGQYQSLIIQHPIVRVYPPDWESLLNQFLQRDINVDKLPLVFKSVDRTYNQDYRLPTWNQVYLKAQGFLA